MALNFLLKRSGTASKRPDAASMSLGELDINYDASTGGLFYKDSAGSVVKVGPAQVSSAAPNSIPAGSSGNSVGEFWYDTSDSVLKVWDGSSWVNTVSTADFLPLTGGTMTGDITFSGTQSFPVSGIQSASTTQAGVVQLNDTLSSTSTTEALTANQGRELQDQINALVISGGLILAGTIDASTGLVIEVTTAGTSEGYTVGDPLPSPTSGNENTYVIVEVAGTMTPPGGSSTPCNIGDWWLSESSSWYHLSVGYVPVIASTSAAGIVQLATDAEVQAGINTEHAVTSSGLQSKLSDSTSTTSSTTIASSTAVKSAYDAGIQGQTDAAAAQSTADAAIPNSSFTVLGDLLVGTGAGTYGNLVPGANGTVLSANSACPTGLEWIAAGGGSGTVTDITAGTGLTGGTITTSGTIALDSACVISPTLLTTTGDTIYASAANTPARLAIGTNGQYMTVQSGIPAWTDFPLTGYTGASNTGYGTGAGDSVTSGVFNVTVGLNSGTALDTGSRNVGVGTGTLAAATSGFNNVALGNGVLQNLTTGGNNVSIGSSSGLGITTNGLNVFVGSQAGQGNSAAQNTFVGAQAGTSLTGSTSTCSVFLGYRAGTCVTTGNTNTFLGYTAGDAVTTGSNNTIIGDFSGSAALTDNLVLAAGTTIKLQVNENGALGLGPVPSYGTAGQVLTSNGTGSAPTWQAAGGGGGSFATPTACGVVYGVSNLTDNSIALGYGALQANRGTCNAAIGTNSMNCSTLSWCCNVSLGTTALQGTTGGATATNVLRNVAIGSRAMEFLGSGAQNNIADNIGIGVCALYNLRAGNLGNIAIGTNSGALAMTSNNVSIGVNSLCRSGVGDRNVVIGNNAASALCGGGRGNVIIGTDAVACAFLTGNFNVIIGDSVCAPVASGSSQLVLGYWMTGCSNQSIRPLAGIVDRMGSTGTAGQYLWTTGTNSIQWSASAPSDIRDKEVIGEVATALPVVNGLEVISYHWKDRETNERSSDEVIYGFSAQQMQSVDPILVDDEDEDHLRIYDKKLIPLLVKAIQELSAKNDALEDRISQLEG